MFSTVVLRVGVSAHFALHKTVAAALSVCRFGLATVKRSRRTSVRFPFDSTLFDDVDVDDDVDDDDDDDDDDVGLNVLRCWAGMLGTETSFSPKAVAYNKNFIF